MRLGQLARKLSVRQQEIVEFLSSRNQPIEDGSNTRLSDDQVNLLISRFAPESSEEELAEAVTEMDEELPAIQPAEIAEEVPVPQIQKSESLSEETSGVELPEVIKAPKVELQGLKVLGKIELPSPKKKTEETKESSEQAPAETRKPVAREERRSSAGKPRPQNRTAKNPIAQAREREAEEQKRKREEAAELAKERRTQNYHKKIKAAPPTKRAQLFDEQVEVISATENENRPKGFWGKIKQWFKS